MTITHATTNNSDDLAKLLLECKHVFSITVQRGEVCDKLQVKFMVGITPIEGSAICKAADDYLKFMEDTNNATN